VSIGRPLSVPAIYIGAAFATHTDIEITVFIAGPGLAIVGGGWNANITTETAVGLPEWFEYTCDHNYEQAARHLKDRAVIVFESAILRIFEFLG